MGHCHKDEAEDENEDFEWLRLRNTLSHWSDDAGRNHAHDHDDVGASCSAKDYLFLSINSYSSI